MNKRKIKLLIKKKYKELIYPTSIVLILVSLLTVYLNASSSTSPSSNSESTSLTTFKYESDGSTSIFSGSTDLHAITTENCNGAQPFNLANVQCALAQEASQRSFVELTQSGDYVEITNVPTGVNAMVLRYAMPDGTRDPSGSAGGGINNTLNLNINYIDGTSQSSPIYLTSRESWLYGNLSSGDHLSKSLSNSSLPAHHVYDEVQIYIGNTIPIQSLRLNRPSTNAAAFYAIDFIELESVGQAPLSTGVPSGFVNVVTACGVTPYSATNRIAFDGRNDTVFPTINGTISGAFTFHLVSGGTDGAPIPLNPKNPTGPCVNEKVYYTSPNDSQLWAVASANFSALNSCMTRYEKLWFPPGKYYINGQLVLPNNAQIQGAGMWFTKLIAVNTASPTPVPEPSGITYNVPANLIAGNTGNFTLAASPGGSSNVSISDLSMFGNVVERDSVDNIYPQAISGEFTNSNFSNLWIEHYVQGIVINGNSNEVAISNVRVRNTLADGIDFYGGTTNSTIENCHVRSSGDDSFAIWAQSNTVFPLTISSTQPVCAQDMIAIKNYNFQNLPATQQNSIENQIQQQASGNTISGSWAEEPWFGNGFAVYGGSNNTITGSYAIDTAVLSGIKLSTNFSPYPGQMSASISSSNLYRCGGPSYGVTGNSVGAVQTEVSAESIGAISYDNLVINAPMTFALGFDSVSNTSYKMNGLQFQNIAINNANPGACGYVSGSPQGSTLFSDVTCYPKSGSISNTSCTIVNSNGSNVLNSNGCIQF